LKSISTAGPRTGRSETATFAHVGADLVLDRGIGGGARALGGGPNVTSHAGIEGDAQLALDAYGRVDVLYVNAGILAVGAAHEVALHD
jgi:NAD(P)-dependent dehydrogenase (short-subunit alcohol dehydrogenase family)